MYFKLKKPNIKEIKKEDFSSAFSDENKNEVLKFVKKTSEDEYLFWDKFQRKEPSPSGITKEVLWYIIKFFREQKSNKTIIKDVEGNFFQWSKLDYFEELIHRIDLHTGGEISIGSSDAQKLYKQKLVSRGILEEAIASSQLEGASTSRKAAKKMIQEGRKPRNESEQMILNNYLSLKAIEEKYKEQEMSMSLLLELHALTTENTFDSDGERPRLRKEGETIFVKDKMTGDIYHEGPVRDFIDKELKKLIDFANDNTDTSFIHPIVKAIMIHFWMGYLHPFTDGNGRLARLLFYWYLLRKGYWAFAYLPISKMIKKSPNQYSMAYVYSEQDDNDLTYFIDYNFKKIDLALKDFKEYLSEQLNQNVQMKTNTQLKYELNLRQIQLLQHLFGDMDANTTLNTHININQISKATAHTDLKDLVKKGFLITKRQGKYIYYYATPKIKKLFL